MGRISAGGNKGQPEASPGEASSVRTVVATNDPVRLSFLHALLRDAGVEAVLLDSHVSAVEGSIGAVPRRIAVPERDWPQARRVLTEAGEWS